jgi:hypothetical protein
MADLAHQRVLLCRPHGGLNDTLCRISHCWIHAMRFGRHLLIDTSRCAIRAPFDDLFELVDGSAPVSCVRDPSVWSALNAMRCRPACIEGRLDSARAIDIRGAGNVMDEMTRLSVRFAEVGTSDFERDHSEQLLVHEGHGGGTESALLLPHLRLTPAVRCRVKDAISTLPPRYSALHVRHTDYQTDYRTMLRRISRMRIEGPMLVCSDDPRVIDCARRTLRIQVLSFSGRAPSRDQTGALHHPYSYATETEARNAAVDSIVDLMALGNAQRLFCGATMNGPVSGFSFLACHLCRNKGVADALLSVPREQWREPDHDAATVLDIGGSWRHRAWLLRRALGRVAARLQRRA